MSADVSAAEPPDTGRVSAPVLYRTRIRHARRETAAHRFSYRHTMWLVDLDELPRAPRWLAPLLRFEARDHLGDPDATIRANVDAFVGRSGLDLSGGRVLMLANPRSLGHAFNPLTVFWCYDASGARACVVAEVQNTHGERHCYLVLPDRRGRAEVEKTFYVSPFLAVDGSYDLHFSEPGEALQVAVTLRRGPDRTPVFHATLTGRRGRPVRSIARAALRHPAAGWRATTLIRWEGLRLWLRRIPVIRWSPQSTPSTPADRPVREAMR